MINEKSNDSQTEFESFRADANEVQATRVHVRNLEDVLEGEERTEYLQWVCETGARQLPDGSYELSDVTSAAALGLLKLQKKYFKVVKKRPYNPEAAVPQLVAEETSEQTETRITNFRSWFGKSKTIDRDGKPIIYYHGTGRVFEVFDRKFLRTDNLPQNGLGFFFADNQEYGEFYGSKDRAMAVYLKMEKPYYLSGRRYVALNTVEKVEQFLEELRAGGYDGIIIEGGAENIVLESNQIKSVRNKGTFDSGDPNIYQ